MSAIHRLGPLFLALCLVAAACSPYRGGGGGGDDDDAAETGPVELTVTFSNQTGYDMVYVTVYYGEEGEYGQTSGYIDLADGMVVGESGTMEDMEYGAEVWFAAWAVDVDEWCVIWSEQYTVGPEFDVEIEFAEDAYVGYVPEMNPPLCGAYGP